MKTFCSLAPLSLLASCADQASSLESIKNDYGQENQNIIAQRRAIEMTPTYRLAMEAKDWDKAVLPPHFPDRMA